MCLAAFQNHGSISVVDTMHVSEAKGDVSGSQNQCSFYSQRLISRVIGSCSEKKGFVEAPVRNWILELECLAEDDCIISATGTWLLPYSPNHCSLMPIYVKCVSYQTLSHCWLMWWRQSFGKISTYSDGESGFNGRMHSMLNEQCTRLHGRHFRLVEWVGDTVQPVTSAVV